MCRRKGTLSIILILLFSALLSASTALVLFLTRGSAAAVSHEEGLRSVYAAESGANWLFLAFPRAQAEARRSRWRRETGRSL